MYLLCCVFFYFIITYGVTWYESDVLVEEVGVSSTKFNLKEKSENKAK